MAHSILLRSLFLIAAVHLVQGDFDIGGLAGEIGIGNGNYAVVWWGQFLDLNGDGLVDILYQNQWAPNGYLWKTYLNTGDNFCLSYASGDGVGVPPIDPNCNSNAIREKNIIEATILDQRAKIFSTTEVARILETTEEVVLTFIKSGELKARKIGSHYKIHLSSLEEFLAYEEKSI